MLKLHAWILSNDVGRRKVFLRQQPTEWLEHRKSLVGQCTKESGESSLAGVSNGRWIDPLQVSLIEMADFLVHLHEEKKLAKSTIEAYRTAIGHVLRAVGVDMMEGQALSTLMANITRCKRKT